MLAVTVIFDEKIPSGAQGVALLAMEQKLREMTGMDCRVFKERKSDDSKLRMAMTPDERSRV